jgi:hypothetical protein
MMDYCFSVYSIILPNNMSSRVEQLPLELWISIFSYLEAHDLFEAFTNLNSYFDYLLASNHLQFNIIFRKTDSKLFRRHNILNTDDSILNRTISLTFEVVTCVIVDFTITITITVTITRDRA